MKGSEKINCILAHLGLNAAQFAKALGLKAPQNIYDIMKDKVDISKDVALRIIDVYPQFDLLWLLSGKGAMLKSNLTPATAGTQSGVSLPTDVWQLIKDQQESIKARDRQFDEMIDGLKSRDRQIDEVIALLREQIKKGESLADGQGYAAPAAVRR